MHRFFGLLALGAVGLGLWVLFSGADPAPLGRGARALSEAPVPLNGWALGLLMGLLLAWFATIDWRSFPERFSQWLRLQRRRLGLIILGGLCAGILLLL
jgi:hypothetical protein